MHTRSLDISDLELICRHREAMFRDAGRGDDVLLPMTENFREWLKPRLLDGAYFGFVMSEDGVSVASVGLMLIDWPPHPLHPEQDKRGYVLNVFVEPSHRGRGLAGELMKRADDEFIRRGVSYAVLHATDKGRPLYQKLGWSGTSEMAKAIRSDDER